MLGVIWAGEGKFEDYIVLGIEVKRIYDHTAAKL